jgi:hypothetical protein
VLLRICPQPGKRKYPLHLKSSDNNELQRLSTARFFKRCTSADEWSFGQGEWLREWMNGSEKEVVAQIFKKRLLFRNGGALSVYRQS